MNNNANEMYSLKSEETLLGAMVNYSNQCLDVIRVSGLKAEDFYREQNKLLFRTLLSMADEDISISVSTVGVYLEKNKCLRQMLPLLTKVSNLAGPFDAYENNIKMYADRIMEYSVRRDMQNISQSLSDNAQNLAKSISSISADIQERLTALVYRGHGDGWQTMKDNVIQYLDVLMRRQSGEYKALQTGFIDIDKSLGGFEPGQLILLAARPSMGKTALALNIAMNVCEKGKAVLFVSQEMTMVQLIDRELAAKTQINGLRLKHETLTEEEMNQLILTCEEIKNSNFDIFDKRHTIAEIKARALLTKAKLGHLDLVVIDHIQLIKSDSSNHYTNRVHEVGEISHALKEMAMQLNVPVLALSQLSRAPEGRTEKRPELSDLRESGDLEQDADVVLGLYRESYYMRNENHIAELGILKARDAECKNIQLYFYPQFQLFRSARMHV